MRQGVLLAWFLAAAAALLLTSTTATAQQQQGTTATQKADDAQRLLAAGDSAGALDAFNAAVAFEPTNTQLLYKRAAALLTLGRSKQALKDLDRVIELNPNLDNAYLRRGQQLLKQGDVISAQHDFAKYKERNPSDAVINSLLEDCHKLAGLSTNIDIQLKNKEWDAAIQSLSASIEIAPHSAKLRLQRANCFKEKGETESAIADYKRVAALEPENLPVLLTIAELHLSLGELDGAMEQLKNCLHSDPENKACMRLRKDVKAIKTTVDQGEALRQQQQWTKLITHFTTSLAKQFAGDNAVKYWRQRQHAIRVLCEAEVKLEHAKEALQLCQEAYSLDNNDWESLGNKAEAELLLEDYESALRNYRKAVELSGNNDRMVQGLKKAEGLERQSKKVDYYKLFGLPRTATKAQIKSAYRKLSREWHPDRYQGDDIEKAQSKQAQLNLAYEVLSDDAQRARYDAGDDPNDPVQQQQNAQQQQFHQQQQFFQQFGGFPFGGGGGGGGQGGGGGGFHFHFG